MGKGEPRITMVPVSTSSGPGPFTAHDRHWEGNAIDPAPLAQTAGARPGGPSFRLFPATSFNSLL